MTTNLPNRAGQQKQREDDLREQVASLQQQLASALQELEHERTFRCEHEAATAARAQVIAQVKALIEPEDTESERDLWFINRQKFVAKLDALQPDQSLAVLTLDAREQALTKAYNAATSEHVDGFEDIGASEMAEARRLLQLPTEPR